MSNETIQGLIENLGGGWRDRHDAHEALLALGQAAAPQLVEATHHRKDQVRWEAMKILSELADPSLAPVFVAALARERNDGNRWVASHALMNLGTAALRPLLEALVQQAESPFLRDGAHVVLRALVKEEALPQSSVETLIKPVLAALEGMDPAVHVPFAAHRALDIMAGRPTI